MFDESRYFEPGPDTELTFIDNQPVGVSICEDLWNDEEVFGRGRCITSTRIDALAGVGGEDSCWNISASPFVLGKNEYRHNARFQFQAKASWNLPIFYVNQVGGNDDLVFDGNSVVFDREGRLVAQAKDFEEDLLVVELDGETRNWKLEIRKLKCSSPSPGARIASIHAALILGLRDYVAKCGFKSVVLGLSGGIDSAVVAALAAECAGARECDGGGAAFAVFVGTFQVGCGGAGGKPGSAFYDGAD